MRSEVATDHDLLLPERTRSGSAVGDRFPSLLRMNSADELPWLRDTRSRTPGDPGGLLLERLRRPIRWLILVVFLIITTAEWLPFFMAARTAPSFLPTFVGVSWTTVVYYRTILEVWLLGVMTLLIAIAGAHDHTQKRPPCSRTAANMIVHGINILPLLIVIPWWGGVVGWDAFLSWKGLTVLADGLGYISGKCCLYDMALCLLPIARQSLWLNAAAKGFPEGISFHRLTGWWCVIQVLLHSLTELGAMLLVGYTDESGTETPDHKTKWHGAWAEAAVEMFPWVERLNEETGVPELNTEGVVNFAGLIGTMAMTVLALFSLSWVRRACYDVFYLVHVPAAGFFIIMSTFHDFPIMIFAVPGLVSYFFDRTNFLARPRGSKICAHAAARVLSADWIRLDVLSDDPLSSEASLGTQWAYLRIPSLGTNEWHAFSLADRSVSFIIKATGDWTKKLHTLVAEKLAAATVSTSVASVAATLNNGPISDASVMPVLLEVELEGVYGNSSPPWSGFDRILFVGGGVGVAPWLSIMTSSEPQHQQQERYLIWVGRDANDLAAMSPFLPSANTSVFLTRIPNAFRESIRSSLIEYTASSAPLKLESDQLRTEETAGGNHKRSASTTAPLLSVAETAVTRHNSRPILFFLVAVLSLLTTSVAHYYIVELPSEEGGVKDDKGGGEADVGARELWHYFFVMRMLPVACSLLSIVLATLLSRWVEFLWWQRYPSLGAKSTAASKAPLEATEVPNLTPVPAGLSTRAAEVVEFGRPDMCEQIAVQVGTLTPGGSLFVCVCGPPGMIKSCRDAVKAAQREHRAITFGFHAEEPDW